MIDLESLRSRMLATRIAIFTSATLLIFLFAQAALNLLQQFFSMVVLIVIIGFFLTTFRFTRRLGSTMIKTPIYIATYAARATAFLWTHRGLSQPHGNQLLKSLREHSRKLKTSKLKGEIEVGYTVGGIAGLRKAKLPEKVIKQGLLITGHYAEDIANTILSNIKTKTIVIGRGYIPISYKDNRRVGYITIGKGHQFNPFTFNGKNSGEMKRWAETLATSIGVSSTLQTSHFDALNSYLISTTSRTPSSEQFTTLDWIDEIDGYTSVTDSFDIKNALRTLLLHLDSVSARGDVTMNSLKQLLNDVDVIYLDLGELDDRAYKFITSFILLSSNGFRDIILIIFDFNLLAPPIRSLEYQHLPLWRKIIDAAKRENIVLVSRSCLLASQLYNAMPNVIASSLQDYEGLRTLSGRLQRRMEGAARWETSESILGELHEQEAIACLGSSLAVFAFTPQEIIRVPEEEAAIPTEKPRVPEEALKTSLWRDFKEQAGRAYNILGYAKLQGTIEQGELEREYPESSSLISQLMQDGYLTSIQGKTLIHAKGEYAMKEWSKTTKKREEETQPISQPIVQPQLEAFKEPIPPLPQDLRDLLERAERKLSIGANSAAVTAAYMFVYRSLKLLAGLPTANTEELVNALRARGYLVNRSEVSRAKAVFINTRRGRGVTEEDAKACLETAKRIASLFPKEKTESRTHL